VAKLSEIIALKAQLVGADASRHSHYDTMLDAAYGNYYDRIEQSMWQKWEGIVYERGTLADGRKKLRIVINLVPQIVEAKRALWSVLPQIRVPYRSLSADDVEMSDRLERAYRYLWQYNRIGEKLGDGGWYAGMLGTAVFCVYPDFVDKRPRIVCRSPYGFYGVPGNIEQDGTAWKQVMFVTRMRGRQANAMWAEKNPECSPDQLVDIIEYWDEKEKFTFIEQTETVVEGPVPNRLSRVPVITVPNIAQPGVWWGKGDPDDALSLIGELNKRFNVENLAFSDQAGAPWEAINPDMDLEDITLDPDGVNRFGPGGGMKKSQTGGLPWQMFQSNQMLRQLIDSVTDFPQLLRDMISGSNISGKAINNALGPGVQARIELRQRYLHPRMEMLNKYAMLTWAKYWGGETHIIGGSEKGKRYNIELRPDDFEGYYENEVFVDSSTYFDTQSKVVIGLQMIAAGGLSKRTFVEKLNPWVDDAMAEFEQIRAEEQERVKLAMMAQMMTQNPMGVNPDVGKPSQDAAGLQQGFQTTPTPMAPPPGVTSEQVSAGAESLSQMASPLTGAEGEGDMTRPLETPGLSLLGRIADAVRSLTNVTGRVFLTGSILEGEPGPEGIEIWFTDMVDWATVRQALAKQVPETKGQLNPQQGIPTVASLEITPGTSSYEPTPPQGMGDMGGMLPPEGTPSGMPPMMEGM
jgi:hypothetical protein